MRTRVPTDAAASEDAAHYYQLILMLTDNKNCRVYSDEIEVVQYDGHRVGLYRATRNAVAYLHVAQLDSPRYSKCAQLYYPLKIGNRRNTREENCCRRSKR